MTDQKNISQKEVAGFLLGLGIGLVVGLLFQSQPADQANALRRDRTPKTASAAA